MQQTSNAHLSVDTSMRRFSNRRSDSEIVAVKMLKGMLLIFCVRFNCTPYGFIESR